MITHNEISLMIESLWLDSLDQKSQSKQSWLLRLTFWLLIGLFVGLRNLSGGLKSASVSGIFMVLIGMIYSAVMFSPQKSKKTTYISDSSFIRWNDFIHWLLFGLVLGLIVGMAFTLILELFQDTVDFRLVGVLNIGLIVGIVGGLLSGIVNGFQREQSDQTAYPGQRLVFAAKNFLIEILVVGSIVGLLSGIIIGMFGSFTLGIASGLFLGLIFGLIFGYVMDGSALINYYTLRFILARSNLLPWRLVPFLDHCVDLIFLRRVGGGYIFVHRLLMEHFAEMYVEKVK